MGINQPRTVQPVSSHYATDGVGDQFLHGVLAKPSFKFLSKPPVHCPLFTVHSLPVAVGGVHREGDLLDGDVGGELVLKTVGVDEEVVVLLFEALHLGDGVAVLGDPGGVAFG